MKRWYDYKNSAQTQLTTHFLRVLLVVFIVSNLIFILASIAFSYDYLSKRADNIITAIESDQQMQSQSDWRHLVDAYVSANDEDALRLTLPSGSVYYSQDAADIFSQIVAGKKISLLPGIYLADDEIYYVKHQDFNAFSVEVALDTEEVLGLTFGLLKINVVLNVIGLILGAILIYFKVGRWSKKLTLMTQEIEESKEQLTVPKTPTEIKQMALAFNDLLLQQQQAIVRENQFVADAAHDLKTPIAAIRGHVKLILRRGKQHPEVIASSLGFIDTESQRLQKLTQQLLVLSKAQKEEVSIVAPLDVSTSLENLVEHFENLSKREFKTQILPHQMLRIQATDFEQIIQNLLENALKYSQQVIAVSLTSRENILILQVIDRGKGISDDDKKHIFERFYRVENSRSNKIEGSGIGLAIVKSLVEKSQGEITVLDNPQGGTIFQIKWPLQK